MNCPHVFVFSVGQTKRLTELSSWARQAFQTNTERLQRAERILVLSELARKLESAQERMLPFVPSALQADLVDAELSVASGALGTKLQEQFAADEVWAHATDVSVSAGVVVLPGCFVCRICFRLFCFLLVGWSAST